MNVPAVPLPRSGDSSEIAKAARDSLEASSPNARRLMLIHRGPLSNQSSERRAPSRLAKQRPAIVQASRMDTVHQSQFGNRPPGLEGSPARQKRIVGRPQPTAMLTGATPPGADGWKHFHGIITKGGSPPDVARNRATTEPRCGVSFVLSADLCH